MGLACVHAMHVHDNNIHFHYGLCHHFSSLLHFLKLCLPSSLSVQALLAGRQGQDIYWQTNMQYQRENMS